MDIEQVKKRVQDIEVGKSDDEMAHTDEDRLMLDFIEHVQDTGDECLSDMATEVLKTRDIKFARWCA